MYIQVKVSNGVIPKGFSGSIFAFLLYKAGIAVSFQASVQGAPTEVSSGFFEYK